MAGIRIGRLPRRDPPGHGLSEGDSEPSATVSTHPLHLQDVGDIRVRILAHWILVALPCPSFPRGPGDRKISFSLERVIKKKHSPTHKIFILALRKRPPPTGVKIAKVPTLRSQINSRLKFPIPGPVFMRSERRGLE